MPSAEFATAIQDFQQFKTAYTAWQLRQVSTNVSRL